MKRIILSILYFVCICAVCQAEPDLFGPKKPKPFIRKLYGSISIGDGIGFSGNVFTRDHSLYTFRYLHEDRSLTGSPFWENSPKSHLSETGLMYGKGFELWRLFLNGSAGVAYVTYSSDLYSGIKHTGGLIANLQANISIKPYMAIGIECYGDLNAYQTRTGVLINLQFGKVRG